MYMYVYMSTLRNSAAHCSVMRDSSACPAFSVASASTRALPPSLSPTKCASLLARHGTCATRGPRRPSALTSTAKVVMDRFLKAPSVT